MELRQLRYLVAVVDEGGFTRAAERLHVAQPGVSAQIRRLERELGQELLDRSGRSVRPTPVGAAVLPHARAAVAAAHAVGAAVEEHTGLLRGHVAVGSVAATTTVAVELPALLAAFHERHPAVRITLAEARADQLLGAVAHGTTDLAVAPVGSAPPPGLAMRMLADEPLVAAVVPGDPLAARAAVSLTALRDRDLICTAAGTGLRALLDDACARAGFHPRVAFEAGDPPTVAELAAHGLGVAIVPASVAQARVPRLHAVALRRPEPRGRLALVWRERPTSPAARALVAHATEWAERRVGG